MLRPGTLVALILLLLGRSAAAQPPVAPDAPATSPEVSASSQVAPSPSPPATATPPPPTATPPSPTASPPPGTATPPPALPSTAEPLLDRGLELLVQGDLAGAEAVFLQATAAASTPEGRTTASIMAARVRALRVRALPRLVPGASVGSTEDPPVVARDLTLRRLPTAREDSARPAYLVTSSLLGLGLWGWTLPVALGIDPDDRPQLFLGLYMTAAASGFVIPYALTSGTPPTWGEANLAFYGGTRGAQLGVMASNLLFGASGGNTIDDSFDRDDIRALSASMLVGSVGGFVGGHLWAGRAKMTPGEARTIGVLGDFGLLLGFGTGHLLGLDDDDDADVEARGMGAAGLLGMVSGIAGGRWLGRERKNTWGDGEIMRAAGILGAYAGLMTPIVFDYELSSKGVVASVMVGAAAGVFAGDALVKHADFSFGHAIALDLALVAGGLGGAGLTYLFTRTEVDEAYAITSTLGAGLGFTIVYLSALKDARPAVRPAPSFRLSMAPQLGRGGLRGVTVLGGF